jgi:hypothetical protein
MVKLLKPVEDVLKVDAAIFPEAGGIGAETLIRFRRTRSRCASVRRM